MNEKFRRNATLHIERIGIGRYNDVIEVFNTNKYIKIYLFIFTLIIGITFQFSLPVPNNPN